jgi:hypothetical protein
MEFYPRWIAVFVVLEYSPIFGYKFHAKPHIVGHHHKKKHWQDGDESPFPPLKVAMPQLYINFSLLVYVFQ